MVISKETFQICSHQYYWYHHAVTLYNKIAYRLPPLNIAKVVDYINKYSPYSLPPLWKPFVELLGPASAVPYRYLDFDILERWVAEEQSEIVAERAMPVLVLAGSRTEEAVDSTLAEEVAIADQLQQYSAREYDMLGTRLPVARLRVVLIDSL
jgi:hypothetical protein